jgi:hypothetical protein
MTRTRDPIKWNPVRVAQAQRVALRHIQASYFHGPEGVELDLGDGVVLRHEGYGVWKAWEGTELVASFLVSYYHGSDIPALADAEAFKRGAGIGRRAIKALVHHYGRLRSSHNGNTSPDASRAWKALGARALGYGDTGFGGSHYFLSSTGS